MRHVNPRQQPLPGAFIPQPMPNRLLRHTTAKRLLPADDTMLPAEHPGERPFIEVTSAWHARSLTRPTDTTDRPPPAATRLPPASLGRGCDNHALRRAADSHSSHLGELPTRLEPRKAALAWDHARGRCGLADRPAAAPGAGRAGADPQRLPGAAVRHDGPQGPAGDRGRLARQAPA